MADKSAVSEKTVEQKQNQKSEKTQQKKQPKYVNPVLGWGLILAAAVIAAVIGFSVIPPLA